MSDTAPTVLELVPFDPTNVAPRNDRPDAFVPWENKENIEFMATVISDSGEFFDIYLSFVKIDVRVSNNADTMVYVYVVDKDGQSRTIAGCELNVLFSPDAL